MLNLLKQISAHASMSGRTEMRQRMDYLDGWRGLAISFVLLNHFFEDIAKGLGRFGVDIFFVLSGMLMCHILFVKKTSLTTFYKRRISRIFPAFFLYVSSIYLIGFLFLETKETDNYLYSLFFLRTYLPTDELIWFTGLPIGHLWSLNVEEHAYILLSIITLIPIIKRYPGPVILVLGLCAIGLFYHYSFISESQPRQFYLRTEVASSFILISGGYSLIKHHISQFVPSSAPIIAFLLALSCYTEYRLHWSASWTLAPILLAFSVNHLDLLKDSAKTFLEFPLLRLLGLWSFSIYLWQQVFYIWGVQGEIEFWGSNAVFMAMGIACGLLSFYFVEQPIRKYMNDHW